MNHYREEVFRVGTRLEEAVRRGDCARVRSLLRGGLLRRPPDGRERADALLAAVDAANVEMVLLLFEHNQACDATAALCKAIGKGWREGVRVLLAAGTDISVEYQGTLPLVWACRADDPHIVHLLLQMGASVSGTDSRDTPLCAAAQFSHHPREIIDVLVEAGADVNALTTAGGAFETQGTRPIHCAASAEAVEGLLAYGADLEPKDGEGSTPVHTAAAGGRAKALDCLLRRGAKHDSRDREGMTPLHRAAIWGNSETIRALLAHGADINAHLPRTAFGHGGTPFDCAYGAYERALGEVSPGAPEWSVDRIPVARHWANIETLVQHGANSGQLPAQLRPKSLADYVGELLSLYDSYGTFMTSDKGGVEAMVRKIGHQVWERGGHAEMVFVCDYVRSRLGAPASQLERAWDGIGDWRA